MGTWGHGIRQSDTVCDVIGDFEQNLKHGKNLAESTAAVLQQFAEAIDDADDGPLIWIGLADMQWTYGQIDPGVLQHLKADFESGRSLIPWNENERDLHRRKTVLKKFISKIESPNPKPKKPPKIIARPPRFQPGVCLSVLLSNGQFGAAIVVAVDHSNVEHGMDLVGLLEYMSPDEPSMEFFQERNSLYLTHCNWKNSMQLAWYLHSGFRKMKSRLKVVGRVDVLETDAKSRTDGIPYAGWEHLGQQTILRRGRGSTAR